MPKNKNLSLPLLDISKYLSDPVSSEGDQFVEHLRDVCHNTGFFYLTGHGIANNINNALLTVANDFFALPINEREEIAIGKSPHFRGYTLLENEQTAGKEDWRDQIDIGPEEPALNISESDPPWLRLRGPNQWPNSLPKMAQIVDDWMQLVQPVGMALMQALARGLGQEKSYFDERMQPDAYTRIKIIRYPAQPSNSEQKQGLGLHHDSGILTLILQDSVAGLQVMNNGQLIDVEPIANSLVVNLGEMMQSATNGYLPATKHQVVSPSNGKQRISIAYFMNPRLDAVFKPIPLPKTLAANAPGGQNSDPNDPVFATFGINTLKTRMRSHPDVRQKYYADVDLQNLE